MSPRFETIFLRLPLDIFLRPFHTFYLLSDWRKGNLRTVYVFSAAGESVSIYTQP